MMLIEGVQEIEPLAEIHWGDWDGKRAPQLKKLLAKWAEGDYEGGSEADC